MQPRPSYTASPATAGPYLGTFGSPPLGVFPAAGVSHAAAAAVSASGPASLSQISPRQPSARTTPLRVSGTHGQSK